MKPGFRSYLPRLGRIVALLLVFISCISGSHLYANTISSPVSVAIPIGLAGELASKPVSFAFPMSVTDRPVSVAFPLSIMDRPVSIAFPDCLGKPVSFAVQQQTAHDPDLVGLWRMDGDWLDSSGNDNHGVPYNGATFSTTHIVGSFAGSFDGSDDYVQGTTSGFPLGSSSRTIMAWIKTGNATGDQAIFHYGVSNASVPSQSFQLIVTNGKAAIGNGTGTGIVVGTSLISDDKWHLLVGLYEGTSTNIARIYVDGIEQKSGVITAPATASQAFTVGRFLAGGGQFNGLIDELAIYKRALTLDEIIFHHASGISDPNAPVPPTLNTLPATVGTSTIALAGNKPAGTSIWINGKKVAALDNLTTWNATYTPLLPGNNILEVTTMDSANRLSTAVTARILYDNVPPPPPVINPVQSPTTLTTQIVSGDMEAGATIIVTCPTATTGNVTYPTNTTWSVAITGLTIGNNNITVTARDAANNSASSSATITVITGKPGDCDGDGKVTIAEVQAAINMYLGLKAVAACVDIDGSNSVTINEVQKVINGYLGL
ncbi:MAG: LamG-like jellyroll fold domain-containing protein [Pedobacter sp.]